MSSLRAIIADDEPIARERVRTLLGEYPDITAVAECADGRSALEAIAALAPEVVFLDVEMPELDGFAVLDALGEERAPEIIFVTAHDAYALRAFEVHAIDYLLKPFTRDRFRVAVDRVRRRVESGERPAPRHAALLGSLRADRKLEPRLALRTDDGIYLVRVSEIDRVEAAGNYVRLHAGDRVHTVRDTLGRVEARLDPARFVRVHRSAIVSIDHIERLEPWFHGEFVVVLRDGTRLTSSRSYSERLRALIG
ncbi:MAG TPA: LytTR family DNA-binding domain-containing protein [Kofleriaceae bacterium]|nr:LytTR family DNA-binding domain-containing protein [Kofleriaceae bacterium]